ncbi:unnamed protein product [Polarella glacialis]|uniref:GPR180/TMEM145 transmembrane domain-containing protein n=1 Tax=Polarella glacialis TaxID=89957 RepID=A0A813KLC3_POLGL|nr:unnamed protein product [Polarella glacialis]CAE8707046.1 unnamed protein product [Polarella glacialis]
MQEFAAIALLLAAGPEPAHAKHVSGVASLAPRQARVIAKFCFDYNPACKDGSPCSDPPGRLDFEVFGAKQTGGGFVSKEDPRVYVALLDDEYFSFPEVSQVWSEANCSDVTKSAKRSFELHWADISKADPGASVTSKVIEKVRPRWWYVAIASCSDQALEMNYRLYLENSLQGSQKQLSMDEMSIVSIASMFLLLFAGLAAAQIDSWRKWQEFRNGAPAGHSLLLASVVLAAIGQLFWLSFFQRYKETGETTPSFAITGRASAVAAKTIMQIMLVLLAQGESVCTPGISWVRHKEMVAAMVFYGFLSFALESWGDREASGSRIEYIYDTRAGTALVAMELMWLYVYTSRCWNTFQNETRARPRRFYKHYASALSLWFAALPLVAALAAVLAPWVRYRIVFLVSNFAHVLTMSALVYILHPRIAPDLLDLNAKDHEVSNNSEELAGFLGSALEDEDSW